MSDRSKKCVRSSSRVKARTNSSRSRTKTKNVAKDKRQSSPETVSDAPSNEKQRSKYKKKRQTTDKDDDASQYRKKAQRVIEFDDADEEIVIIEPQKTENVNLVINSENDRCCICMDEPEEPKVLDKCGHRFCTACIDQYFTKIKPQCPCCFMVYGVIRGNQPKNGHMSTIKIKHRLPGFENNSRGTIQITYVMPDGIQEHHHPNPGQPYRGTTRTAYLPDNHEGKKVLNLLKRAFELDHIFTVGQSRTTNQNDVVTWNDIHHKTSIHGGAEFFGYPDETYLNRVQQELASKGIR